MKRALCVVNLLDISSCIYGWEGNTAIGDLEVWFILQIEGAEGLRGHCLEKADHGIMIYYYVAALKLIR